MPRGRRLNVERIRRVVQAKELYGKSNPEIAMDEKITRERVRQIYQAYLKRMNGSS